MLRLLLLASLPLALSSCNSAAAAVGDATNPAHCAAAFSYGATWIRKGDDLRAVIAVEARLAYEMAKLDRAGRLDVGSGEAIEFTERYAGDGDGMMALFEECGNAQDKDPIFKASLPNFIQLARRANKQCQSDPKCAVAGS